MKNKNNGTSIVIPAFAGMTRVKKHIYSGFTLIEIIVALFIFSIVSLMMVAALHNILNNQSRIEQQSKSFSELQLALLLLSNDLEQAINRPILNSRGEQEAAFLGNATSITFTHAGVSNPFNQLHRSTLQRTQYQVEQNKFIRKTWPVLDQTEHTQPLQRLLLNNIFECRFSFFDQEGHFQKQWPPAGRQQSPAPAPSAVQVSFTLKNSGKITQYYVIPIQTPAQTSTKTNEQKAAANEKK